MSGEVEVGVRVTPPDDEDGTLPEPPRERVWWFWVILVGSLASILVGFAIIIGMLAFTPKDPAGSIDAATLVALFTLVLNALREIFRRRSNG